ncbi:MAG: sulfate adenylyltransferase [Bacteroidetes bacterium 4572_128]|nr:MAG: sulfate adenylyltransferase [Bacteroidetes bacterium 4572_128]
MPDKITGYLDMKLLRFTTAGSVDDGKSTLIGRLLYDSKAIFEDQLKDLERTQKRKGEENINLALLTDGLKDEREQGITIDVAYRYFATPKRKFIIADTPGHVQYTRNMVTGASTANLAIILIDARKGVIEQTLRHSYIASLLRIQHLLICVNKMDLVNYEEKIFEKIKKQFKNFCPKFNIKDIHFVPISALKGDNIVKRSENMDWYFGATLMHILENVHIENDINFLDARFPIQNVIRPQNIEFHDYRAYTGRVTGGIFRKKEKVKVLPSGFSSIIKSIDIFKENLKKAFPMQSVSIRLEDEIDISRGDMIVKYDNIPKVTHDINLMICWFDNKSLKIKRKYAVKHTTKDVRCIIKEIKYKININNLEKDFDDKIIKMNDIACINIRTTKQLFIDTYKKNRITGSLILIDESSNQTVASGMVI